MEKTDLSALRARFNRRLQAQAERLMAALEAIPIPDTHIGLQRVARAAVLVAKAIDQILPAPEDDTDDESEIGAAQIELKATVATASPERPRAIVGWEYTPDPRTKRSKRRDRKRMVPLSSTATSSA